MGEDGDVEQQEVTPAKGGDNDELGLSTQSKMRKRWNAALDVCLLKEISQHEPFAAPHGQTQDRWAACVNALNANTKDFPWSVDARGCRDRFNILVSQYRGGEKIRKGTGGSEEDIVRRSELLQDLVQRLNVQMTLKKERMAAPKTPQNASGDRESAARITPSSTDGKRRRLDMDDVDFEPVIVEGLTDAGDGEQTVTPAKAGNKNELGLSTQSKMRKRWNAVLDVCLLKEISLHEPFTAPHGQTQDRWAACVNALNANTKDFPWPVDTRGCRDRFNILVSLYRSGEKSRKGTGGSEEDIIQRNELLHGIVERLDEQISRQKAISSVKTPLSGSEKQENAVKTTPPSTSVKRRRLDMEKDSFESAVEGLSDGGDAEQTVTPAKSGSKNELGMSTQSKMRKRWNSTLDACLLKEISLHEPFTAPHGQTQDRWAACVNALNANQKDFPWPVDTRGCRDRFNILVSQFRSGEKIRKGTGGTEEDVVRRAELLQDLVERLSDKSGSNRRPATKEETTFENFVSVTPENPL